MPLNVRASKKWKIIDMPVSYKVLETDKMPSAQNVFTNQKVLETRHGTSRYNANVISATDEINSISFFKDNSDNNYVLAKAQGSFYSVSATSTHTTLTTGLTAAEKHRAVTFRGRHIMAFGADGLKQFNGTVFTQLGQAVPSAPTVAKSGAGNTLPTATYIVALTFYDSETGFETNIGTESSPIAITLGEKIDITAIPSTAANGNIDKVRIYVKDSTNNSAFLFWEEINLGVTTATVDEDITSTDTPPTKNAAPIAGGGKYLKVFGNQIVYSGNSTFPSDVFFSTPDIPDAFDNTTTGLTLKAQGNGPVTALAVGYYNNDSQFPFLCIFKKNSIEVYNTNNGQSIISENVGCVSQDTVQEINGAVMFMSTKGWHVIVDARMKKDENNDAYDIANGDINDIFTRPGYDRAINKTQLQNCFSVYYPTLNHYMTFVPMSGSSEIFDAYNYELAISGFRPYKFPLRLFDACLGEDTSNNEVVFLAAKGGYILKHSVSESRTDVKADGTTQAIEAFFQFGWQGGDDMDATYNFGSMIVRALESDNAVQARYFKNYQFAEPGLESYDFSGDGSGFRLDVSMLDVGILTDGRSVVRYIGSIYQTAQALLVQFSQNISGANMAIIEAQIDISKNGAPNL